MKMKFKISNILIFAVLPVAFVLAGIGCAGALPPNEEWSRTYGESNIEEISFVRQTSDGGYIIAATTINNDLLLVKTDHKGLEQWNRSNIAGGITVHHFQQYYMPTFLQQTSDNGFIITGTSMQYVWLIKTDSKGHEQWNMTFADTTGTDKVCSVAQTPDGGYLLAGIINSHSGYWLIKTGPDGNKQWKKTFAATAGDKLNYLLPDPGGGYTFAGTREPDSLLLIRIDPAGNEQWNKTIEGVFNYVRIFQYTPDGDYLIGSYGSFIKIDPTGKKIFEQTSDGIYLKSILQTSDGGYMLEGLKFLSDDTFDDNYIVRTDPAGNQLWDMTYEDESNHEPPYIHTNIESVIQASDGGYIIVESVRIFRGVSNTRETYIQMTKLKKESHGPIVKFTYHPRYPGAYELTTFDASLSYDADGNITNYHWDFDDGNQVDTIGTVITHPYASSGNYSVVLTITDDIGNTDSINKTVTVQKLIPHREEWNMTYHGAWNDNLYAMQPTTDGGYILAGNKDLSSGWSLDENIWIVKTDSMGKEEWNRTFEENLLDTADYILQTEDGGYIIAGNRWISGRYDVLLIKTDTNGTRQWNRSFGDKFSNSVYTLRQAPNGSYIIAGAGTWGEDEDYYRWMIQTDSLGNEQWNRVWSNKMPGSAKTIQQTSDEGYILAGNMDRTETTGFDIWLMKTDLDGNEEWNRTIEGKSSDIVDVIRQTSDGGYILTGTTWPSDGDDFDILVLKTDPHGYEQWNKTFQGIGHDMALDIMQTTDEGYLVIGQTGWWDEHTYKQYNAIHKIWIIKTDTDGNFQWHTSFGDGHDRLTVVRQTFDGGLVLAGNKETEIGINKGIDFWLMKLGEKSPESLEISNQSQVVPAQTTNVPGFEVLFSIGNLLVVSCLVLRMKRK